MMNQKGYIALISVLVVLALAVLIASSANLASISESDMGLKEQQSWEAFYLASACAEHSLMSLKEDLGGYMGNETLTFTNGECKIENVDGVGNKNRVVKVSGSAHGFTRKIKVEINTVTPGTDIESWEEVLNF